MSGRMPRRDFLTTSLAIGAATLAESAGAVTPTDGKRQVYEMSVYSMASIEMVHNADPYFETALIPALRKAGTGPVGVFVEVVKPEAPKKGAANPDVVIKNEPPKAGAVYVLTVHEDLDSLLKARSALQNDEEYQKAGASFLAAPPKEPAYTNLDCRLMLATGFMPALEVPEKKPTRSFELRRYRNPSEAAFKKKLEMFATSELAIFRRVGLAPVFFSEMLYGPDMFNITYMLTYPEDPARGKAWGNFGGDPEWKKLSHTPGYTDPEIIANIKSIMLKPTPYSQI